MHGFLSLDLLILAACAWLVTGLCGVFAGRYAGFIAGILFFYPTLKDRHV